MRLKTKRPKVKIKRLNLRCSITDYYEIQRKANIYCEGNVSEYLTYVGRHYIASKDELQDESPLQKRRGRTSK